MTPAARHPRARGSSTSPTARACRPPRRRWCCGAARPERGHPGCRARGRRATSATARTAPRACWPVAAPHLLGVLLDVTSPFHAELVEGLDDAAGDRGLRPRAVDRDATARRGAGGRDAARLPLRGARCSSGRTMSDGRPRRPRVVGPTVVVGRRGGTARVAGVRAADDQGLELAVDHLVGSGAPADRLRRRSARQRSPRARRQGYREAMRRHGLGAQRRRGAAAGATEDDGAARRRGCSRAATGDRPARRVLQRPLCHRVPRHRSPATGSGVPEDVSVVGYDDSPLARLGTVDLTSVSQEPELLARATVAAIGWLPSSRARPSSRADDVVIPPRSWSAPRPAHLPGRE